MVSSKNPLASYVFNRTATAVDEKLQGKNQTAEKEEFEHQQKELEKVCNPIITQKYQVQGTGQKEVWVFPGVSLGPTIEGVEEVNLSIRWSIAGLNLANLVVASKLSCCTKFLDISNT
jgi:L1 cell adhesion molecule like protein